MNADSAAKASTTPPPQEDVAHAGQPSAEDLPELIIEPRRRWWHIDFKELWERRELIYFLIRRDLKVRYRQTSLGMLWAILQPAFFMLVFTIFLPPDLKKNAANYPLYVYSGFLAWTLFASAIGNASQSIINSEQLINKIYFPRLAIPISVVGAQMVDFLVGSLGLVVLMLCYRVAPDRNIVYLPLCVALLMLAGLGAGTLFAALNVRYRDFRYLVPFILQAWMFSTPSLFLPAGPVPKAKILGSAELFDRVRQLLLNLNPMTGPVGLFRATTLGGPIPWDDVAYSAVSILTFVVAGALYFRRVEDSFADII